MQHVNMSSSFVFSTDPFPAFRVSYVFGRRQRANLLLPCQGVTPSAAADPALPVLPKEGFRVIKTKEKGTVMVVPGPDTTRRALLFASIMGGYRGGCKRMEKATSADVLLECAASNNCESSLAVVALVDVGRRLVLHSYGRHGESVVVYLWDGQAMVRTVMKPGDWNAMREAEIAAQAGLSTPEGQTL